MKKFLKYGLIAFVVIIVLGVAFGKGSSDDKKIGEVASGGDSKTEQDKDTNTNANSSANNSDSTEKNGTTAAEKTEYFVGDTFNDDGLELTYVSSGVYTSSNRYIKPAEGKKYIFLEMYAKNNSNSDKSVSSFSFKCYADGYSADSHYSSDDNFSATLSKGRTTSGKIYFEVPENATEIDVEYEYDSWNDKKVKFVYEGDKESGFVPETSATASENAYKVGDIVQMGDIVMTYLSCKEYQSTNMFVKPADGKHYIQLELEVENKGKSDEHISYFDFDCYADGANCDATYIDDNALSATVSSGRKAKGTVTFEVPLDASVVEVEYVKNIWTSDRVVFKCEL